MGDELVEVECWKYMVCPKGLFMYESVDYKQCKGVHFENLLKHN